MTLPKPFRGEIWWVDWPAGRGSEPGGRRPALIVQNDIANQSLRYTYTIIVAISSYGLPVPFHIPLSPNEENSLPAPSFIKCEQIIIVSCERLRQCIGQISSEEMSLVNRALKRVLDID
jgi:mRNA interferase MazF